MSTASELFARADVVLIDFDGPICSVFARHPAELASAAAVRALVGQGVNVPSEWASRTNPHDLLHDLATLNGVRAEHLWAADEAICRYEVEAVAGATPTDGLRDLLAALSDRRWGIVSNNCKSAINHYWRAKAPSCHQPAVVLGRTLGDPNSLKPAPTLVREALRRFGAHGHQSVYIGDSTSDVLAGRVAGVPVIGYANKPGKAARLADAGASAVVGRLTEVLA